MTEKEYKGKKVVTNKDGYHKVGRTSLHRLLYVDYYGHIPRGYHIHHINHIKTDNTKENLIALPERVHAKIHTKAKTLERHLLREECQYEMDKYIALFERYHQLQDDLKKVKIGLDQYNVVYGNLIKKENKKAGKKDRNNDTISGKAAAKKLLKTDKLNKADRKFLQQCVDWTYNNKKKLNQYQKNKVKKIYKSIYK